MFGCGGKGTDFGEIGLSPEAFAQTLRGKWQTSLKTTAGHHIYIDFINDGASVHGYALFHTGDVSKPVGRSRIKDIRYDPTSGKIRFVFNSPVGPYATLRFEGKFSNHGLSGSLISTKILRPRSSSRTDESYETVTLFGVTQTFLVPDILLATGPAFSGVLYPQDRQLNGPTCTDSDPTQQPTFMSNIPCGQFAYTGQGQYNSTAIGVGAQSIILQWPGGSDTPGINALFWFNVNFTITNLSGDVANDCVGGCTFSSTATLTPTYYASHQTGARFDQYTYGTFNLGSGQAASTMFAGPGPNNMGTITGTIGGPAAAGAPPTTPSNLPVHFTFTQNFTYPSAYVGTNTATETVSFTGTMSLGAAGTTGGVQIIGHFSATDSNDENLGPQKVRFLGGNISFVN